MLIDFKQVLNRQHNSHSVIDVRSSWMPVFDEVSVSNHSGHINYSLKKSLFRLRFNARVNYLTVYIIHIVHGKHKVAIDVNVWLKFRI